jgi:glycine/D-amino acid oxidase-like deaminating enzyme
VGSRPFYTTGQSGFRHDALGYWLQEAPPVELTRPLAEDARADLVIVGGGYAGMWTAWAMRELAPEASITLLEAGTCGHGPSGRNAGFVNTFWQRFEDLAERFGDAASLDICAQAARTVDEIGAWADERGIDVWYRKGGHLKVATSAAQDDRWLAAAQACARVGVAEQCAPLDAAQVRARCASPKFRGGVFTPDAATVQPARLGLGLRGALLEAGVAIHERTRARRIAPRTEGGIVVETDGGRVEAPRAVLAIGGAVAGFRPLRNRLAVTSTHMTITEPVPDVLEEIGWTGGECISTARIHVHYFRTTPDGRIAFGSGGGRMAYGARIGGRVEVDPEAIRALRSDLMELFPALRERRFEHAWGGPVDVSPNHLPIIGTLADGVVHYVCGFTGNGVGPSRLAGTILARMVLDRRDELTRLAIVEPSLRPVPPEPLRYVGGTLVRAALARKEASEDAGARPDRLTEAVVGMPRRLGIHIGR